MAPMNEFQKSRQDKNNQENAGSTDGDSKVRDKNTTSSGQRDERDRPSNPKMPPSGNLEYAGQSDNTKSS
jgi:hypothetical protein